MTQQELALTTRPLAHKDDPESSHLAAEGMARSGRLSANQARVLEVLTEHGGLAGMTAEEINEFVDFEQGVFEVRRRCSDLKDPKLNLIVRDSGSRACKWRVKK